MTLNEIEKLTGEFSDARQNLIDLVQELEERTEAIKKEALPAIRRAVGKAADREKKLRAAIEEASELFTKPKTRIFHDIRVGYMKSKGGLSWDDMDQVLKLIKKHFPDEADILIKTSETPSKTALAVLSAADLKKLGVTVSDDTDEVVIKPTDSEIDKLINALLKDEEIEKAA